MYSKQWRLFDVVDASYESSELFACNSRCVTGDVDAVQYT